MSKEGSKEKPKNLWAQNTDETKYRVYVTNDTNADEKTVFMEDLEKRKAAYGICGECNEPGTGWYWCQSCNAKRFEKDFKNWTSGDKNIDEFIQQSQLNAKYHRTFLEWLPFEKFENVDYIAKGGFGEVYSAKWPEGYIHYWKIEDEKWKRFPNRRVALKSLDGISSTDFLNEIRSHLQVYLVDVVHCFGITQNTDTNKYMMVLNYCRSGNLREFLKRGIDYDVNKIDNLYDIANGLLGIHNSGKVHKDLHSGNILFHTSPYISDLGMCQPANEEQKKGIYGVLPYVAPEVIRGRQYTQAADIYSFGIIMNEYLSEETPYRAVPHDYSLALRICKGHRPEISNDTPGLLIDLIKKCWDAKVENRPTANELHQMLEKWKSEKTFADSEICKNIRGKKDNKSKNVQTHPQAIYTSRLLNFENLPEPVNSSDLSSSLASGNIDLNLDELDLNDDSENSENNTK